MKPIKPPEAGQVLRICRWPDVFETSHSRRFKNVSWISCPVSFNSTGYHKLLDTHDGMEAAAMYGAWLALCQLAAQSERRGVLCGEKGELYNSRRIARMTGLPVELFELLIAWALTVEWLEWALPNDPYPGHEPPDSDPAPSQVRDTVSKPPADTESKTLPNTTPPNTTKQDPTQPIATTSRDWGGIFVELQSQDVQAAANAVKSAKRNGWNIDHANAVVAHANKRSNAWTGYEVYQRWLLPASVDPSDGWPEPSKECRESEAAAKRAAALARQQEADRERKAAVQLALERERADGGIVSQLGAAQAEKMQRITSNKKVTT